MKRFGLIVVVIVAVLLAGCLAPKVNVKIVPNPIVITAEGLLDNDFFLPEIKLHLSTSGISFSYTIEEANAVVLDENGDPLFDPKVVEIDMTTPIAPGIKITETLPAISVEEFFDFDESDLDIGVPIDDEQYEELKKQEFTAYYEDNWQGKVYKLVVNITGKNPTKDEAEIRFE